MQKNKRIKLFYDSSPINQTTLDESMQDMTGELFVACGNLIVTKDQVNYPYIPFVFYLSESSNITSHSQACDSIIAQVTGRDCNTELSLINNHKSGYEIDLNFLETMLMTKKTYMLGPGFCELGPYVALKNQGVVQIPNDLYEIPLDHLKKFTALKDPKLNVIDALNLVDFWDLSKFLRHYFPKTLVINQLHDEMSLLNLQKRLSVYKTKIAHWHTGYFSEQLPNSLSHLSGDAEFVFSVQAIDKEEEFIEIATQLLGDTPNEGNSLFAPRRQITSLSK